MDTISEKLQAILAKAAELHGTDILWHTPNETLYEAVNFYVCAQSATIGELKALVDQQAQAMRRADVALQEQAAEIERLKGLLDVNRNVSVGVQPYDAELFREKDAEIERLKAASERSCAELLLLRDMEHERCRVARQEADRLKAALAQTWQPVDEDNEELPDLRADDDRGIFVHEDGRGIEFFCEGGELEGYFQLPEGYAVCRKVQP